MIYKYQRFTDTGPNGATYYFKNADTEPRAVELAEVDNWFYVYVPEGATLPDQPQEISWTQVDLAADPALKEQIKANSRQCQIISETMQAKIREVYSLEDEQYFARIGVGVALNVYTFQPGEQEALLAFGAHVEAVRQWGREERAKIGL